MSAFRRDVALESAKSKISGFFRDVAIRDRGLLRDVGIGTTDIAILEISRSWWRATLPI